MTAVRVDTRTSRTEPRDPMARPKTDLRVSVVITTYNRPKTLARILRQVAAQTLLPDETLVMDDHGPDPKGTRRAVTSVRGRLPSLRLIRNSRNHGLPFNRTKGIREARFPLIALADDDDEWHPDKLRRQVAAFREQWDSVDLVYTWHRLVVESKGISRAMKPVHRGVALGPMLGACFFQPSSVMVKRSALLKNGPFDESMKTAEDWEFWVRFFRNGFSCAPVKALLTTYHLHLGSKSFNETGGLLTCLFRHFPAFLRHNPPAILRVLIGTARRKLGVLKRRLLAPRP